MTVEGYQQAYCCSMGDRHYLVHQVYSTCPHCSKSKVEHIAGMVMVLVTNILSTESVAPPGVDTASKRVLDPQLAVWAAFNAFPNQFLDATKNWVKGVQESQVTGEVINCIVPNYQVHGVLCNKECHGTFVAQLHLSMKESLAVLLPWTLSLERAIVKFPLIKVVLKVKKLNLRFRIKTY